MLRELHTFIAVVRHGSFSNAAARIGLTQSAVSAQIHRLEEELGVPLFDRNGRSAILNAAGYEALAVADEVMAAYSKLGRNSSVAHGGLVRIGAISSAQFSFLPEALAAFRVETVDCRVRVLPGVSLNLLGQVDSGEIDMAVIVKPRFVIPSDLFWRPLLVERFILLAKARDEKRFWRELLENEPLIRYDRNSFDGRIVDQFIRKNRITVRDAIEVDELQTIVKLVQLGQGVAILPDTSSLEIPKEVVCISLGDESFVREIGLVERPSANRQSAASVLVERILAAAKRQASEPKREIIKSVLGLNDPLVDTAADAAKGDWIVRF